MNEYKELKTVAWCFYAYAIAASKLSENQYIYINK
jgi:hypothetical protein